MAVGASSIPSRAHSARAVDAPWVLLIYTVPAQPSRKRAAIWREVKRLGAIYLRDGVCALPERDGTTVALRTLATRVAAFGGEATLAAGTRLDPARAAGLVAGNRADRAAEWVEIGDEAERLLGHLRREALHRALRPVELAALARDLDKLRRWADQVRARDYFGGEGAVQVTDVLARCDETLAAFSDDGPRRGSEGSGGSDRR